MTHTLEVIMGRIENKEWDWFGHGNFGKGEDQNEWQVIGNSLKILAPRKVLDIYSLADLLANPSFCKAVWGEKEIDYAITYVCSDPFCSLADVHDQGMWHSTKAFQTLLLEGQQQALDYITETMT